MDCLSTPGRPSRSRCYHCCSAAGAVGFFSPVPRSASCTALQSAHPATGTCPESEQPNFMSDVSAVTGGAATSGGGTAVAVR